MKKTPLLLGLLVLMNGCNSTEPKPENIDFSTQTFTLTKDICKKCYGKIISLKESNKSINSKMEIPKKVYRKWGDIDLVKEDNSTIESLFCDSISESYLKENCDFLKY